LALAAGCGPKGPSLLGRWEGVDSEQGLQTFVFERGGTAHWVLEYQGKSQTFDVRYRLDRSATPHHLDLTGFASGPLAGQALYCLAEVGEQTLSIDCRPGEAKAGGETARPRAFSEQAVRCRRL
jgi:hypothetical protein